MSNMVFTIDAIPTPKIDLAEAFETDLMYYVTNKKMPPLGRSALKQMEDRLNNYLKYVNESFIQDGFSAASPDVSSALDTKMSVWSNDGTVTLSPTLMTAGTLTISPEEKANILYNWTLCGSHKPDVDETTQKGVTGTLTVEIWMDNTKQRTWKQRLNDGYNLVSCGICFANQVKGPHVVQLRMALDSGTMAVDTHDMYAYGYGQIVR